MTTPHILDLRLNKLTAALPSIIGKTISDIVIMTNPSAEVHLFLVFSDGTHYEFYGMDDLNGARWVDPGGVDRIAGRVSSGGICVVVPTKKAEPSS